MAAIDLEQMTRDIVGAMTATIGDGSSDIAAFAKGEAAKIAASVTQIGELRASGVIDDEEMALHLDIQRNASRAVLMAVKGVGILTAERAVNAALSVATRVVGQALGIGLLHV